MAFGKGKTSPAEEQHKSQRAGACLILLLITAAFLSACTGARHTPPQPIDQLLTTNLPASWEASDLIDSEEGILVEETFISNNNDGYLSISIYSYRGRTVWSKPYERVDWKKKTKRLNHLDELHTENGVFYVGTSSSDDMPDMVVSAFAERGDYVFEFRLSNSDDQVTDKQKENFRTILRNITFKDI